MLLPVQKALLCLSILFTFLPRVFLFSASAFLTHLQKVCTDDERHFSNIDFWKRIQVDGSFENLMKVSDLKINNIKLEGVGEKELKHQK